MEDLRNFNEREIGSSEYRPVVSGRVKDVVYFATDTGMAIAGLIAGIMVVMKVAPASDIYAVAGFVATFLAQLKVIFNISSKKGGK